MRFIAKGLISGVGLTMIFAGSAFANGSRVNAMGGDDRLLLDDNTIRYRFPHYLIKFHDVNVEDGASFSIVHDYGDASVGAMHDATPGSTNWLDLMYARDNWGVIIELDHWSAGEDLAGYSGAWATFGTEAFGGDFAVGGGFASSDPVGGGDTSSEFEGHLNYRGLDGVSSWFNLGPMAEVTFWKLSDVMSTMWAELGIGANHTFGTSGTVVCGVFFGYSNTSYDEENVDSVSMIVLPDVRVGVEYDLANWFGHDVTLRAGADRMTSFSDGAISHSFSQNYGMGVGNDRVSIDGVLASGVLQNGPYIVGGVATGLFSQLSVTVGLD